MARRTSWLIGEIGVSLDLSKTKVNVGETLRLALQLLLKLLMRSRLASCSTYQNNTFSIAMSAVSDVVAVSNKPRASCSPLMEWFLNKIIPMWVNKRAAEETKSKKCSG